MKKIIYFITLLFITVSCHLGLDDLPEHNEADIKTFYMEYRYIYNRDVDNKEIVKRIFLDEEVEVDKENNKVLVKVTVPEANPENNFTTSDREKISLKNIIGYCDISVAANIEPIEGSPALGVPADFSKINKYRVTAADGTIKDWTIEIDLTK